MYLLEDIKVIGRRKEGRRGRVVEEEEEEGGEAMDRWIPGAEEERDAGRRGAVAEEELSRAE